MGHAQDFVALLTEYGLVARLSRGPSGISENSLAPPDEKLDAATLEPVEDDE